MNDTSGVRNKNKKLSRRFSHGNKRHYVWKSATPKAKLIKLKKIDG